MSPAVSFVVNRSLDGIGDLPPSDRADIYSGIAEIVSRFDASHPTVRAAQAAAEAIRESEAAQLLFRSILESSVSGKTLPGADLKTLIKTYRTTKHAVSAATGVCESSLRAYESGRPIRRKQAKKLAGFFGVPVENFLC